jgi:hypothetical protein
MLLATERVHAAHRARFWRDVCNGVLEVDCHIEHPDFRGAIEFSCLGDSPAFLVQMDRCRIHRTREAAARAVDPPVMLIYQVSGAAHGEAADQTVRYAAGQFVLLDTARPFHVQIEDDTRQFILPLDRALLRSRLGNESIFTRRTIGSETPAGRLACSYLSALPSMLVELDPMASRIAERQLFDLVTLAISRDVERSRVRLQSFDAAFAQLGAALDESVRLGILDPEAVAERAGLTVAEANLLLRRERTTLVEALQSRHSARSHSLALREANVTRGSSHHVGEPSDVPAS